MILNNNAGYHCFYRFNIINIADNSNLREITDKINFFLYLNFLSFKI